MEADQAATAMSVWGIPSSAGDTVLSGDVCRAQGNASWWGALSPRPPGGSPRDTASRRAEPSEKGVAAPTAGPVVRT